MKLKQQIMEDSWNYEFPISNMQANHIVDLAEDFAIGFAKWMAKEYWLNSSGKYLKSQTYEELLTIYKETL